MAPIWAGRGLYPMHSLALALANEESGPWNIEGGIKHWELEDDDRLRKRKQRWRMSDSVWEPRKLTSNSKDYCETSAAPFERARMAVSASPRPDTAPGGSLAP
eukprot:6298756-Prymnesium_polylepis.2